MKNTEDGLYHSGNTLMGSQENRLTFDDVLNLLDLKETPSFLEVPGMKGFAVSGMMSILKRHDEAWVKENKVRLIEELEQISEM